VNTSAGADGTHHQPVTACTSCDIFKQEKGLFSHLRSLSTNKYVTDPCSVPIRLRCDTPWVVVRSPSKRKCDSPIAAVAGKVPIEAVLGSAALPIEAVSSPLPKKARRRTLSPESATAVTPPPKTSSAENSLAFNSYLLDQIEIQSQALEALGVKNESLTMANNSLIDENDWLHTTKADLIKICMEVEESKGAHVRQVADLKLLLTTKMEDFAKELAAVKAKHNADTDRDVNFWLAEVQTEKHMVAQLKAELEAVPMTGIPPPESIEDIASCIEQIVNCTTKRGTHLGTKIKIVCESVLTSVFDGRCLSYLLGRTLRPIQGKNPYRRAIEIAKIIDLSGSLINLSAYHSLRMGMEGDVNGKVERNGGWLASKYNVMKCMKSINKTIQIYYYAVTITPRGK
jgi:hypothetical protein